MMQIVWSAGAQRDLAHIRTFHADRSEAVADRICRRLLDRAVSLADVPGQGRSLAGSATRAISLPDIQYVLTYRPIGDRIVVLGVRHTRQDAR